MILHTSLASLGMTILNESAITPCLPAGKRRGGRQGSFNRLAIQSIRLTPSGASPASADLTFWFMAERRVMRPVIELTWFAIDDSVSCRAVDGVVAIFFATRFDCGSMGRGYPIACASRIKEVDE
ncbi:MAG TPA: hypothetical protein VN397_02565 [Candidatus Methylomirabilis sp.]|nr:hypothetical protein [Candidatus Methylomirabilis sp.]